MKWMRVLILLCAALAATAAETVLFEDPFDSKIDSTWRWLREDPSDWRISENALEIRVRPGDANSVRNALLREAPDRRQGRFAVEVTVTNPKPPIRQYEQAGITWYVDGKPVFKLVKELVDGQLMIIPGRSPMTNDTVQLRVVVSGNTWIAQFRPDAKGPYQQAAKGELPSPAADNVSLQCYHGPTDEDHWIRFDDFRVLKLED